MPDRLSYDQKQEGRGPAILHKLFKKLDLSRGVVVVGGVVREWVSLVVSLGVSLWLSLGG